MMAQDIEKHPGAGAGSGYQSEAARHRLGVVIWYGCLCCCMMISHLR